VFGSLFLCGRSDQAVDPARSGQEVPMASGWSVIRPLWELLLEVGGVKFVSKLLMGSVVALL